MTRLNIPDEQPIESGIVSKAIASAQHQVEQQNFEIRKDVLKYDDVMNRQRVVIYGERRKVLEGADLHEQIEKMIDEVVAGYVTAATAEGFPEEWDLDKLWKAFKQLYPISITLDEVAEEAGHRDAITPELLEREILSDARLQYAAREEAVGEENMRELERRVVLSVVGRKWQENLYEMDYLKEGIGLRAMAQRDPLVEYQREGFLMFQTMMESIREESIGMLFNIEVETRQAPEMSLPGVVDGRSVTTEPVLNTPGLEAPARPATLRYTAPEESGEASTHIERTPGAAAPKAAGGNNKKKKGKRR